MLQTIKKTFQTYCILVVLANKMEAQAWYMAAKRISDSNIHKLPRTSSN